MDNLVTYIAENLRLSFAAWGEAHRVGSVIAAIVSLIVAILALMGANAKIQPDTFQGIAILAGAWFIALVVIVTPYRMWALEHAAIIKLTRQFQPQLSFTCLDDGCLVESPMQFLKDGVPVHATRSVYVRVR